MSTEKGFQFLVFKNDVNENLRFFCKKKFNFFIMTIYNIHEIC